MKGRTGKKGSVQKLVREPHGPLHIDKPPPTKTGIKISGLKTRVRADKRARGGGIHIKPENKGKLHKKLGVPEGKKIPAGKLAKAKHSSSPEERKEATFAENAKHWKH